MKQVRNVVSGVEFELSQADLDKIKADPSLGDKLEELPEKGEKPKPAKLSE